MAVVQVQYDPEQQKAAATGQGPLYPEGWYVLQIKSFEHKSGKEGKYPQISCKCEILASFNGQGVGKDATRRFQLHPKSTPWGLLPFLRAAGIPFQDYGNGSVAFDDQMLIGARTKATCSHTKGDSRTFEEWSNDEPLADNTRPAQPQQGFAAPQGPMPGFQQPVQQPQWQPQGGFAPPQQPQFQQQPVQQPMPQQGYPQPMQGAPMQQPMQPPPSNGQYVQQPAPQGWPPPAWQPQPGR